MKRCFLLLVFVLVLVVLMPMDTAAQCAMCQATAESSREAGSTVAEGLNKGVLYIFMMPYLILGTIGFFWWRARKKAQA